MKFNIFPNLLHLEFKQADYDNIKNNLTYGGFLEKRSGIDNGVHLGVDITIDPKTSVSVPCPCTVVDVYIDTNKENGWVENQPMHLNGWGGRIIFKLDDSYDECDYMIYGHLGSSLLVNKGDKVVPGDIVGHVAQLDESGTWFSHIHIQLITKKFYLMFENDLENIDGYCHDMDEDVSNLVSDPCSLIMMQKLEK